MRNGCWLMLAFLCVVLPLAGCATSDHARLQGTWIGHEVGREGSDCRLVIAEDQIEFRGDRPKDWYKGTFTLDEEAEPRHLDGVIQECDLPKYVGKTSKAIYVIENNTLTLAGNEPGAEQRPTAFEGPEGGRVFVLTKQDTP